MRTILAILSTVAVLALAGSAGAMPIDAAGPIPSDPSATPRAPAPSSGTDTWVVFAAAAIAFGAGAGAARLAPVLRLRMGAS
jgi:hypothetical protein